MKTNASQTILAETVRTRDEARRVLEQLHQDKAVLESRMTSHRSEDAMRIVTGRMAIENAIESSRRLIDRLDKTLARAGGGLAVADIDGAGALRHRDDHEDALRVETVQAALDRLKPARSVPTA